MCLKRCDGIFKNKPIVIKKNIGYKVFLKMKLYSELTKKRRTALVSEIKFSDPMPVGRWVEDKNEFLIKTDHFRSDKYPTGFHTFLTHRGAKRWCDEGIVRKVYFFNIVATGHQGERYGPIAVVRQMYIVPTVWERMKGFFKR